MHIHHGTLVANTVTKVTLDNPFPAVEVLNRGTGEIYFTIDGPPPTVGGDDCYVVTAGSSIEAPAPSSQNNVIQMISAATPAFSVSAVVR